MRFEPWVKMRQVLCIEPGAIVVRELADEGEKRDVGKTTLWAGHLAVLAKAGVPFFEDLEAFCLVIHFAEALFVLVAVGIFVAVKVMFEPAVGLRDQFCVVAG